MKKPMQSKNQGMTFLEVSIILFICGVIATIFIQTVRPQDTRLKMLYNAAFMNFSNINKELYLQFNSDASMYNSETGYTSYTDYYSSGFRTFPSDPSYCLQLSSTVNTMGRICCGAGVASNCSGDSVNPAITLSNGQRLLFNPLTWIQVASGPVFGYRWIRYDINGAEGPNNQTQARRDRDIFWFEVTDRGDVFPIENAQPNALGAGTGTTPVLDFDRYLTAKPYGWNSNDNTRNHPVQIPIPLSSIPAWYKTKNNITANTSGYNGYVGPVPFYISYCATAPAPSRLPNYNNSWDVATGTMKPGSPNWQNVCNGLYVHERCKRDYVEPQNPTDDQRRMICRHEVMLPFNGVLYDYKTQDNDQFVVE